MVLFSVDLFELFRGDNTLYQANNANHSTFLLFFGFSLVMIMREIEAEKTATC